MKSLALNNLNGSPLELLCSQKELFKTDIEKLVAVFRTHESLEGAEYYDDSNFCILHFGCVGEDFISQFKKLYNCENNIEYIITVDLLSIYITFDNDIISI